MTKSRIAAVLAGAVFALGAVALPASAATQAELQAQINALMAQLAAQSGVTATFTVDLTVGSTGTQVVALQSWLESKGYLVMPIGVAKGYFGELTRAAVARFQVANGISPTAGYFGPITRARLNAMLGAVVVVPPVGTGTGTGTGTGSGTVSTGSDEGQLINDEKLNSADDEDLDEGENDAAVLAIEMEAEDADMTIDRVDVDFTIAFTSGEGNDLNDYVDSVSLWLDGEQLASLDVDEASENTTTDTFSFRFSGLDGMIREGDVAELVVKVDAASAVDTNDQDNWVTVTIPDDGIRASDEAGISDTYFTDAYSERFKVSEPTAGTLEVSEASSNPDAANVEVDDTNDTSGVVLVAFDLEATEYSDILVQDIPVTIRTSGASTTAQVFKNVMLYRGSTLLATESVTGTTASTSVTFDNLDITIDADDTETFTIKATVNDTEGSGALAFDSGDSASSTVYGSLIQAEDASGDSVVVTGQADGEVMTFQLQGIDLDSVSESAAAETNSSTVATDGTGEYTIEFRVNAFGDDMFVPLTSYPEASSTVGAAFQIENSSGTAVASTTGTTTSALVLVSGGTVTTCNGVSCVEINDGDYAVFRLSVSFDPVTSGFYRAQLLSSAARVSSSTGSFTSASAVPAEDYETEVVNIRD